MQKVWKHQRKKKGLMTVLEIALEMCERGIKLKKLIYINQMRTNL